VTSKKLPSMQFYPGDWRKDPCLQACSLAARGLWIEMLCLMHESVDRGHLILKSGVAMNEEQLARVAGITHDECRRLIDELETAGVLSRGAINEFVCKRMVRDEAQRKAMSEGGRKGGLASSAKRKSRASSSSSSSSSSSTSSSEEIHTTKIAEDKDPFTASEYYLAASNPKVQSVLKSIPRSRKIAVKETTCEILKAIDVVELMSEEEFAAVGVVPSNDATPSDWLSRRIESYYKSSEGKSKFFRSPARWLRDCGFLEPDESWASRSEEGDQFA